MIHIIRDNTQLGTPAVEMITLADHHAALAEKEREITELKERDEVATWYESLVTRTKIGTSKIPSLKSYIEQLERANNTLLAEAVRFVERIAQAVPRSKLGEDAQDFLNRPEVREWREQEDRWITEKARQEDGCDVSFVSVGCGT